MHLLDEKLIEIAVMHMYCVRMHDLWASTQNIFEHSVYRVHIKTAVRIDFAVKFVPEIPFRNMDIRMSV